MRDNKKIIRDKSGKYMTKEPVTQKEIVDLAKTILKKGITKRAALKSPADAKEFLMVQLANEESECFAVLFLSTRHTIIAFEIMFTGTIDQCQVYPREIVRRALELNASAVICAHQHPSGEPEPSSADVAITKRIKESLALVDVRLLDHFVIGGYDVTSLAEQGCI